MTFEGTRAGYRISAWDIHLNAANPVVLSRAAVRFLYVRDGAATIRPSGRDAALTPDTGTFADNAVQIEGTGTIWMFELSASSPDKMAGPAVYLMRSHLLADDIRGERLFRADRIESPPGSATPCHRHRGPGIRRLARGRLIADVGDRIERVDEDGSWFESGTEPVIGTNINTGTNVFIRVMVLPTHLRGGKSSFIPHTPDDALRARAVSQRIFGEAQTFLK